MNEVPLKTYGEEGATFARVCPKCNRYVKSDETVLINLLDEVKEVANADCSRCGRIEMPFLGYF